MTPEAFEDEHDAHGVKPENLHKNVTQREKKYL